MAEKKNLTKKEKTKWKAKEWYDVLSPQEFNNVKFAEILGKSPESLVGRKIEATAQELGAGMSKQNYKFLFRITDAEGLQANTEFIGHKTMENVSRIARKGHTKIDQIVDCDTIDGHRIRIKLIAATERKVHRCQESAIRETSMSYFKENTSKLTLEEIIKKLFDESFSSGLYKVCRVIEPIRRMDIRASEILN